MKFIPSASIAAIGLAALALPHAAAAQGAQGQQAQAAPAPATPAPAAPAAPGAPAAPTSNAMANPAMAGTIAANPNPMSVDLGPWLGKTYITGAVSGIGFFQDNHVPVAAGASPALPNGFSGNKNGEADLSNGMVAVQTTAGALQYYVLAGIYSIPIVGVPYIDAANYNGAAYGPVPEAFLKWVVNDSLNFEAGKLPTLIGEEDTFTFENLNIERGLLWNQENVINRGVQANYTAGPVALAGSWNDGFYSGHMTYITGSATWTVDSANTLVLAGGGNVSERPDYYKSSAVPAGTVVTFPVTPEPQSAEQQYDLSWTWTSGPWMLNPWVQYTHVPHLVTPVNTNAGSTYGAALLASYTFDAATTVGGMSLGGWSLPARVEYINSTGAASGVGAGFVGGPNLLGYGAGSKAWELTVTPTYQYKFFFGRAEASYIKAGSVTPGAGFGLTGTADTQFRAMLEAGVVF